jgi:hypothetical protein
MREREDTSSSHPLPIRCSTLFRQRRPKLLHLMIQPRSSVTRFAKAVVRAELARDGDAPDSDVAQRIMTRLHQAPGKLIVWAGFDVLLALASRSKRARSRLSLTSSSSWSY